MKELKLDLTQDATRQTLQAVLVQLLPAQVNARIESNVRELRDSGRHFHDLGAILAQIDSMKLEPVVKQHACAIYQILAEAEATVHGCKVEETHFHEVGNAEAIANVLTICLSLQALGFPRLVATPVQAGEGTVQCAHGLLDIPAPATAAILARGIPVYHEKRAGEWCTPTSAAILYHFVDEFE